MNGLMRIEKVFEGQAIAAYLWEEKPVWIAKELGRVMGYSEDGKGLLRNIQEWKEELIEGTDLELLEGERLAKFRDGLGRISPQATPDVSPFAPSLLILKESGFHLVCIKSGKPVGIRLRRWLADEVMPSLLRSGSYQTSTDPLQSPALRAAAERGLQKAAEKGVKWAVQMVLGNKANTSPTKNDTSQPAFTTGKTLTQHDVWESAIARDLETAQPPVKISEVIVRAIGITKSKQSHSDHTRVGLILRRLGWVVSGREDRVGSRMYMPLMCEPTD